MGAASAAVVLLAGWLAGATGIGGILVVPALLQFEGMAVQRSIAATALAFALPAVASLWWARSAAAGSALTGLVALFAGSIPGAVVGALLVHSVDARWLFLALGALALASGAWNLFATPTDSPRDNALPTWGMAVLGLAVGVGSALTGTGGPVILVPLLMLLRQPLQQTIVAAQAIQLPIALCASVAHWSTAGIDLRLAGLLGLMLLAGAVVGRWCGVRIPVRGLQRMVCSLLLAIGVWLVWRAV